jgi:hypothetical protein
MGEDIKPVLRYISENRHPEDITYVYYGSAPAFDYYAPFYGLEDANVLVGFETLNRRLGLRKFYEDVEAFNGNERVWFIFSSIVYCGGCEGNVQEFFTNYLNGFGSVQDSAHAPAVDAYLYLMNP